MPTKAAIGASRAGLVAGCARFCSHHIHQNTEQVQDGDVFQRFMQTLAQNHPRVKPLLSDAHFSVDGTLIEAWASFKSFKPKDGFEKSDGSDLSQPLARQ